MAPIKKHYRTIRMSFDRWNELHNRIEKLHTKDVISQSEWRDFWIADKHYKNQLVLQAVSNNLFNRRII